MYHRVALVATGKKTLANLKVLDLACGRGGGLGFLVDHFHLSNGTGVDICSRQISYAIDTFKNPTKYNEHLNFYVGDVENLNNGTPIQLRKYDMILCIEAWHTLPLPQQVLTQVH
jgi:ubiquinone/menaquinone biosynthesis C-methylase UbiE